MKNIDNRICFQLGLIGIFIFALCFNSYSQPCFPQGIKFNSQVEIDDFAKNYPDCNVILGNLEIIGEGYPTEVWNIESLEGLNQIETIHGDLHIYFVPKLKTLRGLENLVQINGSLILRFNIELDSLTGLDNLRSIGNQCWLGNNAYLDLSGLDNLNTIGGNLEISNHDHLQSLKGLDNLVSVNGHFGILNNTKLVSLENLFGLRTINGELHLYLLNLIRSLDGLENINPVSIDKLLIVDCPRLSHCSVKSICNYFNLPIASFEIRGNKQDCNSDLEIIANCQTTQTIELLEASNFYPNPTTGNINIESDFDRLRIFDSVGQIIKQWNDSYSDIDISELSNGMYFLELQKKHETSIGKVIKI